MYSVRDCVIKFVVNRLEGVLQDKMLDRKQAEHDNEPQRDVLEAETEDIDIDCDTDEPYELDTDDSVFSQDESAQKRKYGWYPFLCFPCHLIILF